MTVEVVFVELDPVLGPSPDTGEWLWLGRWQAQLLQPAWDRQSGRRITGGTTRWGRLPIITEHPRHGFDWRTLGPSWHPDGGTRYHTASSLGDAQDRIQRWANRRLTSVEPSPIIRS